MDLYSYTWEKFYWSQQHAQPQSLDYLKPKAYKS